MHDYHNITILLVEDDPRFSNFMAILFREIGIRSLHLATDYEQALKTFRACGADMCILDINLGPNSKNGIQLAEAIRAHDQQVPIIFLTSNYNETYYNEARHTRPSGFMDKELSLFKLQQAIDLSLMHHPSHTNPILAPTQPPPPRAVPLITHHQIFFKVGDVFKAIPIKEVSYFYADRKTTYARVGSRNYPTTVQLKTIEEAFGAAFVRTHKSYLVNTALIEAVCPRDGTITIQGETLPIGNAYRKNLLDTLPILR
jgi:DNA-binding LytR/AlgR family response regulator